MLRSMISCSLLVLVSSAFNSSEVTAEVRFSGRLYGRVEQVVVASVDVSPESDDFGPEGVATELHTLRENVRSCLGLYYRRPYDLAHLTPWELMHASLAFGIDTQVLASGRRVNGLGWLCWNRTANGQKLLAAPGGSLRVRDGFGLQGHDGQFLSILAQCKVRVDSSIKVDGYNFRVADLVAYEKARCRTGTELTFQLIGLVHYLDSDETWRSEDGAMWSISRLIKGEIEQPVVGAACGGTHRMMGLS